MNTKPRPSKRLSRSATRERARRGRRGEFSRYGLEAIADRAGRAGRMVSKSVNLAAPIVVRIIARFLCAAARISHRSRCGRVRRDEYVLSSPLRFLALGGVQHHFCAAFGRARHAACAAVRAVSYSAAADRFKRAGLARKGCDAGLPIVARAAPATCLAVAAQLSKLAGSSVPASAWSGAQVTQIAPVVPRIVDVPLPPRRPQSFARTARPTLEKTARHEYLMDQERAEF